MTATVKPIAARARRTFLERLYLPAILKGLGITFRHFFRAAREERDDAVPRGAVGGARTTTAARPSS